MEGSKNKKGANNNEKGARTPFEIPVQLLGLSHWDTLKFHVDRGWQQVRRRLVNDTKQVPKWPCEDCQTLPTRAPLA